MTDFELAAESYEDDDAVKDILPGESKVGPSGDRELEQDPVTSSGRDFDGLNEPGVEDDPA